ncbi:Lsr2 family protein [Nocardioides sp. C4-1]|uniref:histone-like nucleoid-structuring protein Lsr2 n=1 Tax=Nocardioides sp. C4-1 TaxID=3151851 RepID=UPI003262D003
MAKTTIVHVTDDLDGSKDAQSVTFAFQGVEYTIDLAKKNLSAFEKALKPYIEAATRVPAPSKARSAKSGAARTTAKRSAGADYAAIRDWARSEGLEVSDRGRIPRAIATRSRPTSSTRWAAAPWRAGGSRSRSAPC